jgi:hypothetical protein
MLGSAERLFKDLLGPGVFHSEHGTFGTERTIVRMLKGRSREAQGSQGRGRGVE